MTDQSRKAASAALPKPMQMTRADRIQIVLDLLRGTKDRPDLQQLEAELFQARLPKPDELHVAQSAPIEIRGAKPTPSKPVLSKPAEHIATAQRPSDAISTATNMGEPMSLGFLMNEHPAILAQQLLGQSETERRRSLAACSGALARQVRYLLTDTS